MKKHLCIFLCLLLVLTVVPIAHAEKTKYYIDPYFENVGVFSEGLVAVQKGNKWGYINKQAQEVIKIQYEDAKDFSEGLAAVQKNGKWGFIDNQGNEVIPFQFDYVQSFRKGTALIRMGFNEKKVTAGTTFEQWYIDKKGNKVAAPVDNPDENWSEGLIRFTEDNWKTGYKDKNGNIVVKPIYGFVGFFNDGLALVKEESFAGFIDKQGREVIDLQYKDADNFSEGYAAVKKEDDWNGKWGFIDKSGKEVIEAQFDEVKSFKEGIAGVKEHAQYGLGKWGFILAPDEAAPVKPSIDQWENIKTQELSEFTVKPAYDEVREFHNGMAAVGIGAYPNKKKWGFVDNLGNEIVKPKYDYVEDFSEGLAVVGIGQDSSRKYGFIDKQGNEVIKVQYGYAESYFENKALVHKSEYAMILIDKTGRELKESVEAYSKRKLKATSDKSLILFQKGGKWGLFRDKPDNVVVPAKYDNIQPFSGGVSAVQLNGKWGYADDLGNEFVKPQFEQANAFSNGILAAVQIKDKWGFIDKTGKLVIEPKFDLAVGGFSKDTGVAIVVVNGKSGFIDMSGNLRTNTLYDDVSGFYEGLAAVKTESFGSSGNWGFIDITGKMVIPPKRYDRVRGFSEGLAAVCKDGKWGFISRSDAPDSPDTWSAEEINSAISIKLVPASMQKNYSKNITRKDFCSLVINLCEVKTAKTIDILLAEKNIDLKGNSFTDTSEKVIVAANKLSIVNGKGDGKFDPEGSITREEAAVMLANTAKVLGADLAADSTVFADNHQISSWAKTKIDYVSAKGIMGGVGNGKFEPSGAYTRQQAYMTILRLFKKI